MKKGRKKVEKEPGKENSSSDEELVVVTRYSDVEDSFSDVDDVRSAEVENESDVEQSGLLIENDSDDSDSGRVSEREGSESGGSDLEDRENGSEVEEVVDSEEYESSESETEKPNRPTRTRRPPNIFTYDEIGKPTVTRR